jgi:hypothetical protein
MTTLASATKQREAAMIQKGVEQSAYFQHLNILTFVIIGDTLMT